MNDVFKPTKLGNICNFQAGSVFKRKLQGVKSSDFPFIKVSDMNRAGNETYVLNAENWISEEIRQAIRAKLHDTGSTVFAKIGVALTFNRRRILTRPTLIDNNMLSAKAKNGNSDRFLYYLLSKIDFNLYSKGSALPYLNTSDLAEIEVALPAVKQQKAIAAVLGALDDKIENNQRMNETLEKMARAIFKSWFIDFDPVHAKAAGKAPAHMGANTAAMFPNSFSDGLPVGWNMGKIEDIVDRQHAGKRFNKKTVDTTGLVPVLDQSAAGILGFHNEEPSVLASTSNRVITFANHTCVLRLVDFNFSAINNVIPFKGQKYPTEWVIYASQNIQKLEEYKGHWPTFLVQPVILPDTRTAIAFAKLIEPMVAKISANKTQNKTLAELRDTLLPKLMSGEIRVKNAERQVEAV